jgi:hypothetical protein
MIVIPLSQNQNAMQYYFGLILIAVLSASRCDKPAGATGMMEVLQFGSKPRRLEMLPIHT